jgi:GTPase-activating protein SAC7
MQSGGYQPPPPHGAGGPAGERRNDLSSWWKGFKQRSQKKEDEQRERGVPTGAVHPPSEHVLGDSPGIFGVPLQVSVRYANVAISLSDGNGQSYIYGYVPIVVAKCGVFLKERGKVSCRNRTLLTVPSNRRRRHISFERLRKAHQGAAEDLQLAR